MATLTAPYLNGKPRILGADGRPWQDDRRDRIPDGDARPGGIALPNGVLFISRITGGDNTNWQARYDEAVRHARDSAEDMRHDCWLRSLLQERILAAANLPWELQVPDEKDPEQVRVRDGLTRLVKGVRQLPRIIPWLLEAIWFGRYGVQVEWTKCLVRDDPAKPAEPLPAAAQQMMRQDRVLRYLQQAMQDDPTDKTAVKAHQSRMEQLGAPHKERTGITIRQAWPINGDSIGHQLDGTPYILVNPAEAYRLPGAQLLTTSVGGTGLSLRGTWRERFFISKWYMEARDFFASEEAEAVHGVGVRSHIFWWDWIKKDWLGDITNFISRVGLGINLWRYQSGNPESLAAVQQAARENTDRANLFVPVIPGQEDIDTIQRIEVPTTGCDFLLKMIEYADKAIERCVVGQEGSSSATSASGHSNHESASFMQETKRNITLQDAAWCAEALTGNDLEPSLLNTMQRYTYPEAKFPVWWAFKTETQESAEKLAGLKTLVDLGVKIKADDGRAFGGVSKPADGDELIEPPQPPGAPGAAPGDPGGDPMAALMGGAGGGGPEGGNPAEPAGDDAAAQQAAAGEGGDPDADKGDFLDALRNMRESVERLALRYDREDADRDGKETVIPLSTVGSEPSPYARLTPVLARLRAAGREDLADKVLEQYQRRMNPGRYVKDKQGHEHAGKGPHGGEFVSTGSGGGETKTKDKKPKKKEAKPFEWDGVIDQDAVEPERRRGERHCGWDFYDDEGNHYPQSIRIAEGTYDPNPDSTEGDLETVYRWESWGDDDGYVGDRGEWTADRGEAERAGENFAEENNQEAPEDDEDDEVADDDDDGPYAGAQKVWDRLFEDLPSPPDFDDADVLVGAPEGAKVKVSLDGSGDIEIEVKHPKIEECTRTFQTNSNGEVYCHNDVFVLKPEHRGDGMGLEVFSGQVEACARAGVAYIETHAAHGGDYNGYYTWPLFGYDESVESIAKDRPKLTQRIRETFPDAQSVLDIYDTKEVELSEEAAEHVRSECAKLDVKLGKPAKRREKINGRDWWKVNGGPLYHAKFDLTEGSRSHQTLQNYMQQNKGKS